MIDMVSPDKIIPVNKILTLWKDSIMTSGEGFVTNRCQDCDKQRMVSPL